MNDKIQVLEAQSIEVQAEKTPEELSGFQKWASSNVGRPKKVTQQLIARIAYYLRQGNSMNDSCVLAGIGKTALYVNLKQNEEYRTIIAEAWTQNKQKHIKRIDEASKKDAKFSAWWLGRRYKEEFGEPNASYRESNTQVNISFDATGYIPPGNVLGLKPTIQQRKVPDIIEYTHPEKPTK